MTSLARITGGIRGVPPLVALVAVAGCFDDRLEWRAWEPADSITGELRPEVHARVSEPALGSKLLRVVTFNVWFAGDLPGLREALAGNEALARADVLLLQEIESHPGEPASRALSLAESLKMNVAYAPARALDDGGTHGLAVLTRFPLAEVELMELPYFELPLSSPRRIALRVVVDVGGAPLQLVNVHLDTRLNINERLQQLEPVVAQTPGRLVLGGDLNTNPYLWAARGLPVLPLRSVGGLDPAGAVDELMTAYGFASPTAALGGTFPLPGEDLRLDSLFCRGVRAGDGAVERQVTVSNHYPLWIDLDWPPVDDPP